MALTPEKIGDTEEGETTATRDEMGFTPEERTAWDAMESAGKSNAPATESAPPAEQPSDGVTPPPPADDADDEDDETPSPADDTAPPPAAVDPKTGKQPQRTVNYNKHQRELKKREDKLAESARELAKEREDRIKLSERLAILNEALTAPVPPTPEAAAAAAAANANPWDEADIKTAEDAVGAIDQIQRRAAWDRKQGEARAGELEETRESLADRDLRDNFQRDADAFRSSPEGQHFPSAYQFLKDSRLTELAISLFDKDPTDPQAIFTKPEIDKLVADFNAEEKWVVGNAMRERKSPSQVIMKLAKGRGWKPQAAPPAAASAAGAPPLARTPAPPAKALTAAERLAAETAGAAASRSLSDGGGTPPPPALTAERLLAMDDAEFAKYADNLPKEKLDQILGR